LNDTRRFLKADPSEFPAPNGAIIRFYGGVCWSQCVSSRCFGGISMADPEQLRNAVQALVQVDLNRGKYQALRAERKQSHVKTFKCNRTSLAAYYFEPSIAFSLEEIAREIDFLKAPTGPNKERIERCRVAQQLVSPKLPEVVSEFKKENSEGDAFTFGSDCGNEDDKLREQFRKQNIGLLPRPKNPREDKLGLTERFRIREATLHTLASKLQSGAGLAPDDVLKVPAAIRKERDRLKKDLGTVRDLLITKLKIQWRQSIRELFPNDPVRQEHDIDMSGVIEEIRTTANLEGDRATAATQLIDLHRTFERLTQLQRWAGAIP